MPDLFTQFSLASDATRLVVAGVAFWLFAAIAAVMEWRRGRGRSVERLEQVGWVPWTPLFMMGAMIGGGCLALGLPLILSGG